MRPATDEPGGANAWDVICPSRPSRVAGAGMAGFRDRGITTVGRRAIPHPAVTLVLDFGEGPLIVDDTAGQQHQGSLVAGIGFGAGPMWVRGKNFEAVQVRLSPLVTQAVLGISPADLDGGVAALDDLWGPQASRIGEQLSEAPSWEARFALVDALLARRRRAVSPVDPEVNWAWHRILGARGRIRIDLLATEVGWSHKRLWARFRSQLGLPPKRMARLVRFDRAVHRLAAGDNAARVAADSGYADQAHLHRDVAAFTGITPVAVAGEPWLAVDGTAWPPGG
jgi:AraC-like DNA-binding protein